MIHIHKLKYKELMNSIHFLWLEDGYFSYAARTHVGKNQTSLLNSRKKFLRHQK